MSEIMENKYENIKKETEQILKKIFCVNDGSISIQCAVNEHGKKLIFIKGTGKDRSVIDKLNLQSISNILDTILVKFENIEFENNTIVAFILTIFSDSYHFAYSEEEIKIFAEYITKNKLVIKTSIIFDNCIFYANENSNNISWQNIDFINTIKFIECIFDKQLFFYNINFQMGIELLHCSYNNHIFFQNITFDDFPNIQTQNKDLKINFYVVTFKNDIDMYLLDVKDIKEINFHSVVFKGEVRFSNQFGSDVKISEIKAKLYFHQVEFEKGTEIIDVKFHEGIGLKQVTFHGKVALDNSMVFNNIFALQHINFKKPITLKDISFENISIYMNDVVMEEHINLSEIYNVIDGKSHKIDVSKKILEKDIYIKNCRFLGDFGFNQYTFNGNVNIEQCFFAENAFFCFTTFNKSFDFQGNIVNGNIHLLDAKINCLSNFPSTVFEKIINLHSVYFAKVPNIYSTCFGSSVSFNLNNIYMQAKSFDDIRFEFEEHITKDKIVENITNNKNLLDKLVPIKGMRECLKIFKDALLKTNNILEASKYKVLELYAKEVELDYKLEHKKELEEKITIKEQFDRWFLKLNRATSDHHTDFLKILLFTLSVIGCFFLINIILANPITNFGDYYNTIKAFTLKDFFNPKVIFNLYIVLSLLINFYFMCRYLIIYIKYCKNKHIGITGLIFALLSVVYCIFIVATTSDEVVLTLLLPILFLSFIFIIFRFQDSLLYESLNLIASLGVVGILYSPSIITPFLGAFSEDARNHYLYKAIDDLDDKKALELARIILPNDKDLKEFEPSKTILSKNAKLEQISIFDKTDLSVNFIYEQSNQDKNEQSIYKAKKTLKDYKDELKSSDLLDKAPELKRAVAIDGGVSRLNIAYYLVLAFCIFALQKTMRKNSIIPS